MSTLLWGLNTSASLLLRFLSSSSFYFFFFLLPVLQAYTKNKIKNLQRSDNPSDRAVLAYRSCGIRSIFDDRISPGLIYLTGHGIVPHET